METIKIEAPRGETIVQANITAASGDLFELARWLVSGNTEIDTMEGLAVRLLERIYEMYPYRTMEAIVTGDNPQMVTDMVTYRDLVQGGWSSGMASILDTLNEEEFVLSRRVGDFWEYIGAQTLTVPSPRQARHLRLPLDFDPKAEWPFVGVEWDSWDDTDLANKPALVTMLANQYGVAAVFDHPKAQWITIPEGVQ